jgi:CpeT protein
MKPIIFVLLTTIFCFSCATSKVGVVGKDRQLDRLVSMMQGAFDSHAQSERDTDYYDISLHMARIWPNRPADEGYWLYVEQAMSAKPEKPYRQRIYQVDRLNDSTFASKVYTLPVDSLWIGKWRTPQDFASVTKDQLSERIGCTVFLVAKPDGTFKGATNQNDCESTLRGATYATSIVTVKPGLLLSWDQGFDANEKQVWGATKGGYEFVRKN